MATGPCGFEFREAFSCFHYSESEPKGSDCYEQFREMQECMVKYPSLYDYDEKDSKEKEEAAQDLENNEHVSETNTDEEKKS